MSLEEGVLGNLVGGVSGRAGGGGAAWSWWCFCIFYMSRCFFWGERDQGGGKKYGRT